MTDAEATERLLQFLREQPAELRIITATEDSAGTTDDPRDPFFNVLEPVGRIDQEGELLIAVGRNGSLTIGKPLDLLVRLTEWSHFDPDAPERTRERTLEALG